MSTTIPCPKCGMEVHDEAPVCPRCNTLINPDPQEPIENFKYPVLDENSGRIEMPEEDPPSPKI